MRVFFDTNILVYLFDADDEVKKELACARFEADSGRYPQESHAEAFFLGCSHC